ncbi:MAG: hypothetical protein Q8927_11010 [Bacteroidota bacterium]|nr:hypothetical protein [Bacteroidota bacterium]MDP4247429.1 hypothetical protein [Bacteroidota bacterium]MDP4254440.1 hypothetical protein [Bacteroidota bacterium]MDP4259274.1 hypothetical protein [Bacteroidota bacterium]
MKPATIHEIKQELGTLPASALMELCLRLAKFKKENKELLTYLLFEASDEAAFIAAVKKEMDLEFDELPKSNHYLTKKSLRKILRGTARQIRYMGSAQAEVELLTHFCLMVRRRRIPLESSAVMNNLYRQQMKKIRAAIATMHEDLQYDYLRDLNGLDGK